MKSCFFDILSKAYQWVQAQGAELESLHSTVIDLTGILKCVNASNPCYIPEGLDMENGKEQGQKGRHGLLQERLKWISSMQPISCATDNNISPSTRGYTLCFSALIFFLFQDNLSQSETTANQSFI